MACGSGQQMGIGTWPDKAIWRRKFRWLMFIGHGRADRPAVSDDGVEALPPQKSARPSLTLKEMEAQHLTETIYFPSKPDWKPISLVLYDIRNTNPVFDWIKNSYDPQNATWKPSCGSPPTSFKKTATLELYDGCGGLIETWTFDNAWPQVAEFGELDMSSSEVVVCEVTLRYDRAYVVTNTSCNPA